MANPVIMTNYHIQADNQSKKFIGSGEDVPSTEEELNYLIQKSVFEAAAAVGTETVKAFFHDYAYN